MSMSTDDYCSRERYLRRLLWEEGVDIDDTYPIRVGLRMSDQFVGSPLAVGAKGKVDLVAIALVTACSVLYPQVGSTDYSFRMSLAVGRYPDGRLALCVISAPRFGAPRRVISAIPAPRDPADGLAWARMFVSCCPN